VLETLEVNRMNGVAVMLRRFRSFCKLRTDVCIFKIGLLKTIYFQASQ